MKKTYILSIIAFMLLASSYLNAQVYEAELGSNANLTNKAESNASGTGNNVVSAFGTGSQNKITGVNGGVGGAGTIMIRYSNGDATSKILKFWTYAADGTTTTAVGDVSFPPTGGWNTFANVAIPYTMTFTAGTVGGNNFKLRNDNAAVALEIDKYTISVTGAYVAVSSIAVNPSSTTVNAGSDINLSTTVTPSNATNNAVAWSSSDIAKATVSSTGVVTGVSGGNVTITATSQNEAQIGSSSITVTAINVAVTGVTVSPSTATVAIGDISNLTATIAPVNATNKSVNWTSSNNAIATVSATGLVTGVSAGGATITATTVDGSFTSTSAITVQVVAATGVSVSPSTKSIVTGEYTPLNATVAPALTTNKTVSWSSSNTSVATVSATGVVTGVSVGSATITATTQDGSFTSSSAITVSQAAANYVNNPGFEANTAPYTGSPTGWYKWLDAPGYPGGVNVPNGNVVTGANTGDVIGGTPHSGTNYLEYAGTGTYNANCKQQDIPLPNGTYTLKGWFRGNNGGGYFFIAGIYHNFNFLTPQWAQNTFNNVSVTNGKATIEINYSTTTGGSLNIDDVELTLNQPSITTATPLALNNSNISIYPTVISNKVLNISNAGKDSYEVSILNISGQTVYTNKLNSGNVNINTTFMKSGMYLVRVSNGNEKCVQKVIIP